MGTDHIQVVGAREHNLKGVSVDLPRDSLVVITGLSGSGKSSLAFDTVYQEGQRRFMESLSSYARQFLGQMSRPRVERVDGLSPTLCIDQKTVNRNPRSTVGTVTEILDHLRLLMARLGTARCPECLDPIQELSPGQIADHLLRTGVGSRLIVMAPVVVDRKGEYRKELAEALAAGFLRARIDGQMRSLEDDDISLARYEKHTIELVMDRLRLRPETRPRLVEAIEKSLEMADGVVTVLVEDDHRTFSSRRACPVHGISIPEMEPRLFSFNAPQGMCPGCSGIGWLEDFDLDLLLDVDASPVLAFRPLQESERVPFSSLSRDVVKSICRKLKISIRKKWRNLTDAQQQALLFGADVKYTVKRESEGGRVSTSTRTWKGFLPAIRHVWHFTHLKRLTAYRRRVLCPTCRGQRLNPIALAVDFRGQNIASLSAMNISDALGFFGGVTLTEAEGLIGAPILREIKGRLSFLSEVGLSYLSLNRSARSLSGGESQRIRLAGQVGAGLQGVTYVLDEPSIGLHGRDQSRLLDALERLRDKGNTVLVVEHDTATMARADYLVEVGPGAGREGGHITAAGTPRRFLRSKALTARYLRGEVRIEMPAVRRPGSGKSLVVKGASENNLKQVTLTLPLGTLTVVTGVSGSGKSTLITQVLARALARQLHGATARPGAHTAIEGLGHLDKLVEIDQSPIGRTPRSNPVTYTKAWESIRQLFAATPEARRRGYTKSRFSFNVDPERGGGRCEECSGAGVKTIEMQFLADVQVPCESCGGKRFDPETLEIRYKGKTISEILQLTVEQAVEFFANHRKIHRILATLASVGLTYISLGQPSTTLSGGEAQRIKLASELHRPATGRTLYILDEPTTGLHMADVGRLLDALGKLVDAGNTVLVIEHNTDVIKCADHIIDLGPEGGEGGGNIIASGQPEHIATQDSPTGRVLAEVLAAERAPATAAAPVIPFATRKRKKRPVDIQLRGVSTHNLRGIDVDIARGSMTVITGPSGSGKTSLAFDTLFSEGQRRYVESLSTYARRFLGRMQRAPVESAEGLAPAIAIDQRNAGHNPRSTVATVTEIYDTYRLLYARIGHPHCHHCGRPVSAQPPAVAARTLQAHSGAGWLVADLVGERQASELMREGFTRILTESDGKVKEQELCDPEQTLEDAVLVIDRLNPARSSLVRLSDSISSAYAHGRNHARFIPRRGGAVVKLSRAPECPDHGPVLPEDLTPRHFSFNSHLGACVDCGGLGKRETVDPALLFPDPEGSLLKAMDGRVASVLSRAPRTAALIKAVFAKFDASEDLRTTEFSRPLRRALLYGLSEPVAIRYRRKWGGTTTVIEEDRAWPGIVSIIEGWRTRTPWLLNVATCPTCEGDRLKPELLSVTIGDRPGRPPGLSIADACALTVEEALAFWTSLSLTKAENAIAEQALIELTSRLSFLKDVGLGYLTLDRAAETLSGGEAQRIRLATQLGSRLTGTIYVLDEPTTGLHQRDTERLLTTLEGLRNLGNTLVVVEHDPEVMVRADRIIDMGPGAGEHGGQVVAVGTPTTLGDSLTGRYLSGKAAIPVPDKRRKPQGWVTSTPSTLHNLKSATARFPRGCMTAVTGVSGSGKSTLVMEALRPQLQAAIKKGGKAALKIKGKGKRPRKMVVIDQKPIGRTPRSTPLTYCDLLTPLRTLFAQAPLARRRGYKPGRFSFNVASGRCPHCEGRGAVLVEMHFLSDVWIPCEHCGGRRYNAETLEVRYKGVSIADVLDMTAAEAVEIFTNHRKISRTLKAMCDVGLGYLRLGQPANTLSGGEAQRLKLAKELSIGARAPETCFLLDEPTTGLHFSDVEKLLVVLHRLVDAGHMVVLIEHHLDVIRNADHIIDMGPEGGESGGQIIATGTPEQLIAAAAQTGSWTGRALAPAT